MTCLLDRIRRRWTTSTAEATFAVLEHVLHGIARRRPRKQTPCREYDVAS